MPRKDCRESCTLPSFYKSLLFIRRQKASGSCTDKEKRYANIFDKVHIFTYVELVIYEIIHKEICNFGYVNLTFPDKYIDKL